MFLLEAEKKLTQRVTKVIRGTMYFQQTQKEIRWTPPIQKLSSQLPSPPTPVKEK